MKILNFDIETSKNLLAFSAGVDSTALFFLLLEQEISFDIAIVNYNQRTQSQDEVIYATQLAHKYNKKCFIANYPTDMKFSEKNARDYRHNFFSEIIKEQCYESLITAHQLNDKLEWFLMQLTKGAGLTELIGMKELSYKNNYQVHKPLLNISKDELLEYLHDNNIKYFVDESNSDEKYRRNYFRHNFSDQLIQKYHRGISQSFKYLEEDNLSLLGNIEQSNIEELSIINFDSNINIALRAIDKELKKRGFVISHKTRDELKKDKATVISHKIAVAIADNIVYIAPYKIVDMSKIFKEKCRVKKIPKNIRGYLFLLEQEQLFTF